REAGFDLGDRSALHLLELPLNAIEFTLPHVFVIARDQILRLGNDAQPRFRLADLRIRRGEHAEIPGLIPTDAACRAIGGIPAHERDACVCGTLPYHRPAAMKSTIYAPVAQAVPIGELNDRFGLSRPAISAIPSAGQGVERREEIRSEERRVGKEGKSGW